MIFWALKVSSGLNLIGYNTKVSSTYRNHLMGRRVGIVGSSLISENFIKRELTSGLSELPILPANKCLQIYLDIVINCLLSRFQL